MNIEKVWHLFQNKVLEKFCFHLLLRYLFPKNYRQNSNLPPIPAYYTEIQGSA